MNPRYLLFLLILFTCEAWAQQDPMYTNYMFNKLAVNPGYTGSRDLATATLLYRTQWTGLDGAPKTTAFSIHSPLKGIADKVNIGLGIVRDKIGISDDTDISLHAAYRLDLGYGRLGMGLSAQIRRRQMDWFSSNPFQQFDPSIPMANDNLLAPNFGTGFYFDMPNFYAGISVPRILETEFDFGQNSAAAGNARSVLKRHIFFMAGGVIEISPSVKLWPSTLLKYEANSPVEMDITGSVFFLDTFLLGATYRTGDSIDALVHFFLKKMRVGYSYDFTLTELNHYHNGTHEIMISVDFGKQSKGIDHPRYF